MKKFSEEMTLEMACSLHDREGIALVCGNGQIIAACFEKECEC